jgi:hypothetical protein
MVPSSLFVVWHFQQQVTPNYASYRYTTPFAHATNTRIFGKLNPDQNPNAPAMPKVPECDRCFLYPRNPHLVCAVHPTGPNADTCPDFQENPDAEPEELWEPEGASYYNRELILQPRQRWTRLATVRAAGYPSTIYRPISRCEMTYPQYETPPVHWDCSACGWIDDSV